MRALILIAMALLMAPAHAERLKDLVTIQGVRSNQLIGYGLVVGLDGTGDRTTQTPFTSQSLATMLRQLGVAMPAGLNPQLKNVAAVAVHADLPAFSKPGQTLDVTVSSIGNSGSLRGGSLLMTPLKGVDGQIYAVAQGSLVVGGLGVEGRDGSRVSINVPSNGRIPNGATVERQVANGLANANELILNLNQGDFGTARRIVQSINNMLGDGLAHAKDAVSVAVRAPTSLDQKVAFISVIEEIEVTPADAAAKVVVNARTGTIVIGKHVRVMPAAVTHGSLSVTIKENTGVSQPNAFAQGETVAAPNSEITVEQGDSRMFLLESGVNLDTLVRAVNQVGAAPGDLVAILEALKQAGALRAQLVVI